MTVDEKVQLNIYQKTVETINTSTPLYIENFKINQHILNHALQVNWQIK
jgi:hypothetical protein